MKPRFPRPRRHRFAAFLFRLVAAAAAFRGSDELGAEVAIAVVMGCLLLAVLHDLVAATLLPRYFVLPANRLTLRSGDREITREWPTK